MEKNMKKNMAYTMKSLRHQIKEHVRKRDSYFSRSESVDDEGYWTGEVIKNMAVIATPYDTHKLYEMAEQSDIVRACVDAIVKNVDGFGYKLAHLGDDMNEQNEDERLVLEDVMTQANEKNSFTTLRKLLRGDREVIGYGCLEVIRDNDVNRTPLLFYHVPSVSVRMTVKDKKPTPVDYLISRAGKPRKITIQKRFRRFVKILPDGSYRYFKELNDPRTMDWRTGEYKNNIPEADRATELWFFKNSFGNSVYGCPRWVSNVMDVVGRRKAQYVNMDLFDSQGIPPLLITVSGGNLSEESLEELEAIVGSFRGYQEFNKIGYINSITDDMSFDGGGSGKAPISIHNLAAYRQNDVMFGGYLKMSGDDIRHGWRLPDIYLGISEGYTHSTSQTAQVIAEEQVFIPYRTEFDEEFHLEMTLPEFGIRNWKMVSKGPKIVGASQITKGVTAFRNSGALSPNAAIDLANTAFGTEMSKYAQEWAKYPITLVVELLKAGQLNLGGVDTKIMESFPEDLKTPEVSGLNATQQEMLKSLVFLNELANEVTEYEETGI